MAPAVRGEGDADTTPSVRGRVGGVPLGVEGHVNETARTRAGGWDVRDVQGRAQ